MLIGENVRLRPVTPDDAQLLADWFSDPEYLGDHFNIWPMTRHQWEQLLAKDDAPDTRRYLIIDRESESPTGTAGYMNPFTLPKIYKGTELWWHVHPEFRRRGIATQAVCLLANHLFNATPIARIQATIVVGNGISCRVAEAAGMQREGIYRKVAFVHGRYVDMYLYAIVRDDWKDEGSYRKGRKPF